jgi:hypothetical protein
MRMQKTRRTKKMNDRKGRELKNWKTICVCTSLERINREIRNTLPKINRRNWNFRMFLLNIKRSLQNCMFRKLSANLKKNDWFLNLSDFIFRSEGIYTLFIVWIVFPYLKMLAIVKHNRQSFYCLSVKLRQTDENPFYFWLFNKAYQSTQSFHLHSKWH